MSRPRLEIEIRRGYEPSEEDLTKIAAWCTAHERDAQDVLDILRVRSRGVRSSEERQICVLVTRGAGIGASTRLVVSGE